MIRVSRVGLGQAERDLLDIIEFKMTPQGRLDDKMSEIVGQDSPLTIWPGAGDLTLREWIHFKSNAIIDGAIAAL